MKIKMTELQEKIRGIQDKFRWFHLDPCYCGAPVWMQPCPICGYYPMYGKTNSRMERNGCTKQDYIGYNPEETIFEWYLRSFGNHADPQQPILDYARAKVKALGWEFPTRAEVWDYFHPELPKLPEIDKIDVQNYRREKIELELDPLVIEDINDRADRAGVTASGYVEGIIKKAFYGVK